MNKKQQAHPASSWRTVQFTCAPLSFITLLFLVVTATPSSAQHRDDCLARVYVKSRVSPSERVFDKSFDTTNETKGSFSCYLFVPASRARDAVESFRFGVLYRDARALDRVFKYPLRVIVNKSSDNSIPPEKVMVQNAREWLALQDSKMTKNQVAVIRCAWLGNLTLVGGQSFNPGFIIGDGLAFFSTRSTSDVRITSIDLMPITQDMLARACAP